MLQQKKCVDVPSDSSREFTGFGGSVVQRILHNDLVNKFQIAQEQLENANTIEDTKFAQGKLAGFRSALMDVLHLRDQTDTRKYFGYE